MRETNRWGGISETRVQQRLDGRGNRRGINQAPLTEDVAQQGGRGTTDNATIPGCESGNAIVFLLDLLWLRRKTVL